MEDKTNFFDEWVDKHIEVFTDKGDYINAEAVRKFLHNNVNARVIRSYRDELAELRAENTELQNTLIYMCKEIYHGR